MQKSYQTNIYNCIDRHQGEVLKKRTSHIRVAANKNTSKFKMRQSI